MIIQKMHYTVLGFAVLLNGCATIQHEAKDFHNALKTDIQRINAHPLSPLIYRTLGLPSAISWYPKITEQIEQIIEQVEPEEEKKAQEKASAPE